MTKQLAALASLLLALSAVSAAQEGAKMTAREVIAEITKHVGVPPRPDTVDTFKAGDPDTPVTGVAVTMMATQDVLERAAKAGKNLVITHEPTFYNHLDKTADLEGAGDAVLAAKLAFIKEHNLVVWRFHDGWHARKPDGILLGMTRALGWVEYQSPDEPRLFNIPETSLGDLASSAKKKLKIKVPRVVGDPDMKVKRVALMPGAAGSPRQIKLLEREDVEALVIGETPEWETVEYAADAVTQHKRKALVILGHIPSEQAGMEECSLWLKSFLKNIPVEFVAASEPFWAPK